MTPGRVFGRARRAARRGVVGPPQRRVQASVAGPSIDAVVRTLLPGLPRAREGLWSPAAARARAVAAMEGLGSAGWPVATHLRDVWLADGCGQDGRRVSFDVWGGDIDDETPGCLRAAPLYLRGIPFADPLGYDLTYFPTMADSILDVVVLGLRMGALPDILDECGDRFMDEGRVARLRALTHGWDDATMERYAWDRAARSVCAPRGTPFDAMPDAIDYISGVAGDPFLDDDGQDSPVVWAPWDAAIIGMVWEAHAAAIASVERFAALHTALRGEAGQDFLLALLEEISDLL